MKRFGEFLGWAISLLLAGVFLILKNLQVFGEWGDLIWGGLFAAAGLGFLIWFFFGVQRWWRAIPAFTLLSIGATIILRWRGIQLGDWVTSLVLFGMALGFWAVLLVRGEHWWATIPAGVLTVLGVLLGLWTRLSDAGRLGVLYAGVGLVFALLYAVRFGQRDTRWAAVPAGALLLLGLVTLMDALTLPAMVAQWWPVLLLVTGLGLLLGGLGLRGGASAPVGPVAPEPSFEALPPAPGSSVTETLPEAAAPAKPAAQTAPEPAPATETPIDIYGLLEQQPKEQPSAAPSEEPSVAPK